MFYSTNFKCTVQQTPPERVVSADFSCVKVAHARPAVLFPWMSALRFSIPLSPLQRVHVCVWLHLGHISDLQNHLIQHGLMQALATYSHIQYKVTTREAKYVPNHNEVDLTHFFSTNG